MTIRDSLYFSYAGIKSIDYGIVNVNLDSGMQEEVFAPSRGINEVTVKGRDQPYFQNTKKDPLKFSASFAFEDRFNTQKLREVTRWLTEHDYYQPLFFVNDLGVEPEKIYYALVVDEPTLIHNGLQQGYIRLTFRCDSPYAYSPLILTKKYDWTDQPYRNQIVSFKNHSNERTSADKDGKVILDPERPRWSSFLPGTRWMDLL